MSFSCRRLAGLFLLFLVQTAHADKIGTSESGNDGGGSSWGLSTLKPFTLPVISATRKDDSGTKGPYGRGTCYMKPGNFGDWSFTVRDPKTGYEFIVDMPLPNGVLGKGEQYSCPARLVRDGAMSETVITCKKKGNKIEVHVLRRYKGKFPTTDEATWNIDLDSAGNVTELKYRSSARGGLISDNFHCGDPPIS